MINSYTPDAATLLGIFRRMALLKANDDHARKLLRTGRVAAPYYSYRGQEVIPSVVSTLLRDDDQICTIYRGIHDMLAKGMPLQQLWAEIAGRVEGTCKGKGGPMHLTCPEKGIMVTTGIVGSSMPIANGLAWASRLAGSDRVAVAYFGDGASNIGAFHEALNMAAVWKLPVLFVCQNNRYAEHTAYAKATAAKQIADRGAAYAIPGIRVDGNDPYAMYPVVAEAIARARVGDGPTLIEAMTFRFHGHVFGDADSYIDPTEKAAAIEADPYPRYRAKLISDSVAEEATLAEIEAAIEAELEEAIELALNAAWPDVSELKLDVYADSGLIPEDTYA